MHSRATIAGLGLIALCVGTGCGPVSYIYTVTNKASRALAEAKAADAKKLAPYEYWSAVTYLRMAREKAGEADFQLAVDYGRRAAKMGKDAARVARTRDRAGPDPKGEGAAAADDRRGADGAAERGTEAAAEDDADDADER